MAKYLNVEFDESSLNKLVEQVSFDNMKNNNAIAFNFTNIDSFFHKTVNYFRQGKVADWKKHLSDEMSERIERMVCEKIKYPEQIKYELE